MKFHFIKYIFFTAVLFVMFSSCNEDYLNVNDDPNRVTEVQLNVLLPTTIEATSRAHFQAAFGACKISQQIGSVFGYPEIFSLSSTWTTIYLKSLNNLQQMVIQAENEESPYYAGIGKTLEAINLGLLTDSWEAVPFSEALQGSDNFTPKYDSQQENYNAINNLLDDAIKDFNEPTSVLAPGSNDLAYGGDIDRWLKLAHTLKARYAIHLTNKNAASAASDALAHLAKGMESNDDDFQLNYNSVNKNPWHTSVALANLTGNVSVAHGSYLINIMKNTAGGDPRLNVIADTTGTGASEYKGIDPTEQGGSYNSNFSSNTWHSTESAPILMMTYAEAKFIAAEAEMIAGNADNAYDAYLAGIAANMSKLGVDGSAYMADPDVAVGAAGLTMALIMKEKYIATFLNPESWVDVRRYHYGTDVYPGFEIPDPLETIGGAFQRARYPNNEFDRNGDQVQANKKPLIEVMWRDQ